MLYIHLVVVHTSLLLLNNNYLTSLTHRKMTVIQSNICHEEPNTMGLSSSPIKNCPICYRAGKGKCQIRFLSIHSHTPRCTYVTLPYYLL